MGAQESPTKAWRAFPSGRGPVAASQDAPVSPPGRLGQGEAGHQADPSGSEAQGVSGEGGSILICCLTAGLTRPSMALSLTGLGRAGQQNEGPWCQVPTSP